MKMEGGMEIQLCVFLTLPLHADEWSALCPNCFTPRKRANSTHLIGDWVGPTASLDMVVKRKKSLPESNPSHPGHDHITTVTELPKLLQIVWGKKINW
jgi:hypothetical protein